MRTRLSNLPKVALFLGLAVSLFATPLATITTAETFSVDGRAVSTQGLTSVPLTLGNEIATIHSPVVLYFADGSSVKLAAASRAKLVGTESQPKLILLSGSLDYKLVLGSTLSVTSLDVERKSRNLKASLP